MTYSLVNASDTDDLVNQIAGFLNTNGWTVSNSSDTGTGWANGRQLVIQSPDGNNNYAIYSHLSSMQVRITICGPGGSTSNNLGSQPDEGDYALTSFYSDNYQNVFLFAHGQSFYCVVEYATNRFRHICVGLLNKLGGDGAWTGGQFACGTHWQESTSYIDDPNTSRHVVPFDSRGTFNINNRGYVRVTLPDAVSYDRRFSQSDEAFGVIREHTNLPFGAASNRGPNSITGRTTMVPIFVVVKDEFNLNYRPLGTVEGVRSINIENHNPKDTITLGADTWHVFPLIQKNGGVDEENSATYGMAYKE